MPSLSHFLAACALLLSGCAVTALEPSEPQPSAAPEQPVQPSADEALLVEPELSLSETQPPAPVAEALSVPEPAAENAPEPPEPAASDTLKAVPKPAPLPQDYVIQAKDLLEIKIAQVDELSGKVSVNAQGQAQMPLLGAVEAAGRTPAALAAELAQAYGKDYLQNPQVTVTVLQPQQTAGD